MSDIQFLHVDNEYNAPISMAAIAGDFFFTWGYGELVRDGHEKEDIRKVFDHLKGLLAEQGLTFSDVVRMTCLATDRKHFAPFQEVYREYAGEPFPALSCWPIVCPDVILEIDIVAYRREMGQRGARSSGVDHIGVKDEAGWPLSRAVMAGEYLFSRVWGDLVNPKSPGAGISNVFDYFATLLSEKGMTFDDVVQFNTLLTREDLIDPFQAVFRQRFAPPYPAQTTSCFPSDDVVAEASLIARKDPRKHAAFSERAAANTSSAARQSGDFIFGSGFSQSIDPAEPRGGIRRVFEHVRQTLSTSGLDLADVVRVTARLSSYDFFNDYQGVYREYFQKPFPVRTSYGVVSAGPLLDVDFIAYKKGPTQP